MPIGFQGGVRQAPPPNRELREDGSVELREPSSGTTGAGYELRDAPANG